MSMLPPTMSEPAATVIRLRCGTLTLRVESAAMPLEELCTFGSRRNRKRGFLFISKVLGKHVPVRPSLMLRVHETLAGQIAGVQGPVVVIALAETATGLGQGVFEALLRQTGRDDVVFLHSTRYRLAQPPALAFCESHSHATQHLMYFPFDPKHRELLENACTLVLVDDELTTGRTLTHLAREFLRINARVETVHFVSITDWLGTERRRAIADELLRPARFHALLRGTLHFEANAAFEPGPTPDVTGGDVPKDEFLPMNFGRLGVSGALGLDLGRLERAAELRGGERVLVLGTGEFSHSPYLLALHLERRGWAVHFQSTTRSPILLGEGISTVHEFIDNYHDEIPNYVYNVHPERYDRIIIGYETWPLPQAHRLADILGARTLFFGRDGL